MVYKNLSVCLSGINFDPNYLRTGRTEWVKKNLEHLWQKPMSQNLTERKNLQLQTEFG